MKRFCLFAIALWLAVIFSGGVPVLAEQPTVATSTARETENPTALDRYVAKPDPNFSYKLVNTFEGKGSTGYVFDMISQQWRTADEVDRPIWQHWVTVIVPKKVKTPKALMIIGGGSNGGKPPRGGDIKLHKIARETASITAEVGMVPNEPLTFLDDNKRRSEDSIIAYTWDKYLRTGDEEWPLRLPMTKAVVRAMDVVQAFCSSREGGKHPVDGFVVAGGSKRGWATWTTTIVDKRVVACSPIVIDLLNIVPSFEHHKAALGFWAPAVGDYVDMHIMDWMGTPEYDALMRIVEPYSYLDRTTMPKLLMNSCGDQFFIPDSWRHYVKDLKGPYWFRYVPNTGHGLNASAYDSVSSFFQAIAYHSPIPQYQWSFPDERTIRVETPSKPTVVKLWQAVNPEARDFRVDVIGEAYKATELSDQGGGVYIGQVEKPEKGWKAFMIELTFAGHGEAPFIFTSPVRIVPDVLPHTYERTLPAPKGFLSR